MPIYYVEAYGGNCGLRFAKNIQQAQADALREVGTDNFKSVTVATKDQIARVKAMGGFVPEEREG